MVLHNGKPTSCQSQWLYLLPVMGFSLFKKFLKIVIVLAVAAGLIVFFSQDSFAFNLFGESIEEI